ncbi:MAG: 4-hydroxythreonine-4-phosphate dehydrogenase PdxA [Bacteroidales bacterium]|nr:4-hydroxythreonine-4-phosphate dehydrogenase PdxA [Bacteroidales bacterium]
MEQQQNISPELPQVRIGFTHGDVNGIGYEIIIKTLADDRMMEMITPIVFGHSKVASYHRKTLPIKEFNFNLIKRVDMANPRRANIFNITEREIKLDVGTMTPTGGELAYLSLKAAAESLDHNEIDAIVTAPINKKNIQSREFNFPGHTEFFASRYGVNNYLMLMISGPLRIGVITGHIPISKVSETITQELVLNKIRIMHQSLLQDFGIRKPRIAVLGLNPHAGDNGLIGTEEQKVIIPAVQAAFNDRILAYGPYPADGFFGSSNYKTFDGILAMYHDQGMLPFKALAFDSGVNFTAGLPIVRTSPAHGTAYEIAGKNLADESSMRAAVYLACDIVRHRQDYKEMSANPLEPIASFDDGDEDIRNGDHDM